jgi:putative ABC transport system substrate-binding protein
VIVNLETPIARDLKKELEATHPVQGPKLHFIEAHEVNGLSSAFDQAAKKCQGVLVLPSIVYSAHRWQLTALAEKHKLPTMYYMRDFVDAGGLVSYGSDLSVTWQRAADYVDKIVNGTKAGDLPFEQPRKLELVLNLKAARALRLTVPESILLRADEVIR